MTRYLASARAKKERKKHTEVRRPGCASKQPAIQSSQCQCPWRTREGDGSRKKIFTKSHFAFPTLLFFPFPSPAHTTTRTVARQSPPPPPQGASLPIPLLLPSRSSHFSSLGSRRSIRQSVIAQPSCPVVESPSSASSPIARVSLHISIIPGRIKIAPSAHSLLGHTPSRRQAFKTFSTPALSIKSRR